MGNLQVLGTAYKFIKINAWILLLLSLIQNVIAVCVACHTLCFVRKPPILLRQHNSRFVFSRYHCKELSLTAVWVTPPWDGEVSCKELYSSQLAGSALLQRVLEGTQASKGTKEEPFPAMEWRMRVHIVLSRNSGVCRVTRKLHCISKMTK